MNSAATTTSDKKLILSGLFVAVLVVLLWLVVPGLIAGSGTPVSEAGQIGDKYGSVNALFSGLAFTGIIITILLQRRELHQNTEELRKQAEALDTQVQVMNLSAAIAALPVLIEQERARLRQADSHLADSIVGQMTTQSLGELVEIRERKFGELSESIRQQTAKATEVSSRMNSTGRATENEIHLVERFNSERQQLADIQKSLPFLKNLHQYMLDLENAYSALKRSPRSGRSGSGQLNV